MKCKGVRSTRFLLLFVSATVLCTSTDDAIATETAELVAAIQAYNDHESTELPPPSEKELQRLATGQVVKIRQHMVLESSSGERADRYRIVGYRVIDRPRLLVWLAALDVGTQHASGLTEYWIESDAIGGSLWYQYLRLPWPVKNRHWVVHSEKNIMLAAASDGAIWEQAWGLAMGGQNIAMKLLTDGRVEGLTTGDGEKAVYLPINRGGWTMFALDSHRVLVAVHATVELGGWIPDRFVAIMVSRQLEGMLSALEQRSVGIHSRYNTNYPVFSGDGKPITSEMAESAEPHNSEKR